ncbi:MAG: exo-alpha-sialidase [Acidobacteria bacterium]|nr:exo-alpha-sialidase [Acidobacteriota bacterium]
MTRRHLLSAAAAPLLAAPAPVRREVFLRSPRKGIAVMATSFYTRPSGGEMISIEQRWSRSDTIDVSYLRGSSDHGRHWTEPKMVPTGEKRPNGTWRKHPRAGTIDPVTGKYLEFWIEGVLPGDDPLEGMRIWTIHYRIGVNGDPRAVVHEGAQYSVEHSMPGVWMGKNAVMLGDSASVPVSTKDGRILLPVTLSPLGKDGKLYNPTGGYTYTEAMVIHGTWKNGALVWRASDRVAADPALSTRGMDEPTLGLLDDGRILMVMRGSNDKNHALPGRRWVSLSSDGGYKWTKPAPWTYSTGELFYSPSSCSQLLKHSSGRLFWLGNISPENPKGNRPRYPLVIAEVDRKSGLLLKETLRVVDDRQPGESEILMLSNFYAREDREKHDVVLHMTRLFAFPEGWEGDAMQYHIPV